MQDSPAHLSTPTPWHVYQLRTAEGFGVSGPLIRAIRCVHDGYVSENFPRSKELGRVFSPRERDNALPSRSACSQRYVLPSGSFSTERAGTRSSTSRYVVVDIRSIPKTAVSTPQAPLVVQSVTPYRTNSQS